MLQNKYDRFLSSQLLFCVKKFLNIIWFQQAINGIFCYTGLLKSIFSNRKGCVDGCMRHNDMNFGQQIQSHTRNI